MPADWRYVAVLIVASVMARAEIIDRIAVSVGNRVVTQSDIDREIRVVAFQNGARPDFSTANKHAVAERMIAQKLVQNEVENSRYPLPAMAEIGPAIEEFKGTHYPDPDSYQRALVAAGITEQDLADVLLSERTLLQFIEIRFETGVQVSEREADDYARQHNVSVQAAEKALTTSRADQQMEQWLRDTRRRTPILIHEEALR